MIQFPGTVEIQFHGTLLKFSIVPIDKHIYELSNELTLMKNEDHMTFGYLIHKHGYLYAYGMTPVDPMDTDMSQTDKDKKFRFDVVFSTYVGPEDNDISDPKYIDSLLHSIATAFGNRAMYQVRHPSIVQMDRFGELMDELLLDIEKIKSPDEVQTPYIYSMLDTARTLADFYTNMVKSLEGITEDED